MSPSKFTPATAPTIMHAAPSEMLQMNKYHFLYVLQGVRLQERRFRPRGEWCLIPLGMFITAMQSLLTSEFKDALGVEAEVWKAVAVQTAKGTGLLVVALFVWWLIDKCFRRTKTPEQLCDEVLDTMAHDRERAAIPSPR